MPVVSPVPVEVRQVAVFVPPGTAVAQSAVTEGDVIVRVNGGPGLALVVGHSVTWRQSTIFSNEVQPDRVFVKGFFYWLCLITEI